MCGSCQKAMTGGGSTAYPVGGSVPRRRPTKERNALTLDAATPSQAQRRSLRLRMAASAVHGRNVRLQQRTRLRRELQRRRRIRPVQDPGNATRSGALTAPTGRPGRRCP
jgi:hypothetical protein